MDFEQILNALKGKKTYFTGIACIILGVTVDNLELIMMGLGFMGLRAGIANK